MPDLDRRQRTTCILCALAALLLLASFAPLALFKPAPPVPSASIVAERIALDATSTQRRRVGQLLFLEGWQLRSTNPRFGGISAIHVENGQVWAISDAGWWIHFPVPRRPGPLPGTIRILADGPGSALVKRDRDAEALAVSPTHAWVAFERQDAVWRYARNGMRSDAHAAPEAMAPWPNNSGSEGMVRLANDRFLLFAESVDDHGTSAVLLFDGDPAVPGTPARRLRFRPPAGHRVTDAAVLPDGGLVVLTRRFTLLEGVSAKLVAARLPDDRSDEILGDEEIAELRSPLIVDNMEGLSVSREGGRTILWIASDDNFNPLQRTLLLKFALLPPVRKHGSSPLREKPAD